ncbi:hypothetical protein KKC00_02945 [Patescibacteria group bacterium]|nr:hypothetical protein [Patescibacteria group bacterium]
MFLTLIVYFLAGVFQDILFTLNIRYVSKGKTFLAVLSSFLTVIVSMIVLYNIVTQLGDQRGIVAIIVYAAGIAVGTFFAMKLKIGLKE